MKAAELEMRIEEAYRTWQLIPDPDRGFRHAKMAFWPHFVREMSEGYGWSSARTPRLPPSPEAIDRAEEVLGWFARHLNNNPKGAWALWLTFGRGMSLSQAGRVMRCSKAAVFNRRSVAMGLLCFRLSKARPIISNPLTKTK